MYRSQRRLSKPQAGEACSQYQFTKDIVDFTRVRAGNA